MMEKESAAVMKIERFDIRTRGIILNDEQARELGIKRVYNQVSDVDYMNSDLISQWADSMTNRLGGEASIVECALRFINGSPIYVSSLIVFHTQEMCNVFFIKNQEKYKAKEGFSNLLN